MHGVKKACGKTLIAGVVYVVALYYFIQQLLYNKNVRFIEPQKPKSTISILYFFPRLLFTTIYFEKFFRKSCIYDKMHFLYTLNKYFVFVLSTLKTILILRIIYESEIS